MHSLYFVKLKKDKETITSNDAKTKGFSLLEDEGFFNTGYFSFGKGDWGVIGGRWSGCLSLHAGGKEDAVLLDIDILELLYSDSYKDVECFDAENYEEDTIAKLVSEEDIGKYWIIVIDYHH